MGKESGGKLKEKDIRRIADIQSEYNRINQQTPTGSLTFRGNTAITDLSPEEQAILEQGQLARLLAGQTAAQRFGDLGSSRDDVEQAYFQRALGLLNPEFNRRERALQQRLANQGLPQTSGAYNREFERFERGVNQQLEQAALASVLAGGQEESRVAQMILGLLGAGQPAAPGFINPPQITIPVNAPQSSASPITGALAGAAGLSALGPYGALAGGGLGLLAGL